MTLYCSVTSIVSFTCRHFIISFVSREHRPLLHCGSALYCPFKHSSNFSKHIYLCVSLTNVSLHPDCQIHVYFTHYVSPGPIRAPGTQKAFAERTDGFAIFVLWRISTGKNTAQKGPIMERELLTHVIENSGVDSGMDAGMTGSKCLNNGSNLSFSASASLCYLLA